MADEVSSIGVKLTLNAGSYMTGMTAATEKTEAFAAAAKQAQTVAGQAGASGSKSLAAPKMAALDVKLSVSAAQIATLRKEIIAGLGTIQVNVQANVKGAHAVAEQVVAAQITPSVGTRQGARTVVSSNVKRNLPGRATGGPVQPGQDYLVGERGAEIFRPDRAGTVIPNSRITNAGYRHSGGSVYRGGGGGVGPPGFERRSIPRLPSQYASSRLADWERERERQYPVNDDVSDQMFRQTRRARAEQEEREWQARQDRINRRQFDAQEAAGRSRTSGRGVIRRLFRRQGGGDVEALEQRAIERFGVTDDIREAGFLTPTGKFLDFSGRHQSEGYVRQGDRYVVKPPRGPRDPLYGHLAGKDYLSGQRSIDHYESNELFPGLQGAEAVNRMKSMGFVRVWGTSSRGQGSPLHAVGAELARSPTSAQVSRLVGAARDALHASVDVTDPMFGHRIGSFSTEYPDDPVGGKRMGPFIRQAVGTLEKHAMEEELLLGRRMGGGRVKGYCSVCRSNIANPGMHQSTAKHQANLRGPSRGSGDWLKPRNMARVSLSSSAMDDYYNDLEAESGVYRSPGVAMPPTSCPSCGLVNWHQGTRRQNCFKCGAPLGKRAMAGSVAKGSVEQRLTRLQRSYTSNVRRAAKRLTPEVTAAGMAWYPGAEEWIAQQAVRFGKPEVMVRGMAASLSAGTSWPGNKTKLIRILEADAQGKEFPYSEALNAHVKAKKMLAGEDPWSLLGHTPKTGQFFLNTGGDLDALTIDRWAFRTATRGAISQYGKGPVRTGSDRAFRRVAKQMGMHPVELQAALWIQEKYDADVAAGKKPNIAKYMKKGGDVTGWTPSTPEETAAHLAEITANLRAGKSGSGDIPYWPVTKAEAEGLKPRVTESDPTGTRRMRARERLERWGGRTPPPEPTEADIAATQAATEEARIADLARMTKRTPEQIRKLSPGHLTPEATVAGLERDGWTQDSNGVWHPPGWTRPRGHPSKAQKPVKVTSDAEMAAALSPGSFAALADDRLGRVSAHAMTEMYEYVYGGYGMGDADERQKRNEQLIAGISKDVLASGKQPKWLMANAMVSRMAELTEVEWKDGIPYAHGFTPFGIKEGERLDEYDLPWDPAGGGGRHRQRMLIPVTQEALDLEEAKRRKNSSSGYWGHPERAAFKRARAALSGEPEATKAGRKTKAPHAMTSAEYLEAIKAAGPENPEELARITEQFKAEGMGGTRTKPTGRMTAADWSAGTQVATVELRAGRMSDEEVTAGGRRAAREALEATRRRIEKEKTEAPAQAVSVAKKAAAAGPSADELRAAIKDLGRSDPAMTKVLQDQLAKLEAERVPQHEAPEVTAHKAVMAHHEETKAVEAAVEREMGPQHGPMLSIPGPRSSTLPTAEERFLERQAQIERRQRSDLVERARKSGLFTVKRHHRAAGGDAGNGLYIVNEAGPEAFIEGSDVGKLRANRPDIFGRIPGAGDGARTGMIQKPAWSMFAPQKDGLIVKREDAMGALAATRAQDGIPTEQDIGSRMPIYGPRGQTLAGGGPPMYGPPATGLLFAGSAGRTRSPEMAAAAKELGTVPDVFKARMATAMDALHTRIMEGVPSGAPAAAAAPPRPAWAPRTGTFDWAAARERSARAEAERMAGGTPAPAWGRPPMGAGRHADIHRMAATEQELDAETKKSIRAGKSATREQRLREGRPPEGRAVLEAAQQEAAGGRQLMAPAMSRRMVANITQSIFGGGKAFQEKQREFQSASADYNRSLTDQQKAANNAKDAENALKDWRAKDLGENEVLTERQAVAHRTLADATEGRIKAEERLDKATKAVQPGLGAIVKSLGSVVVSTSVYGATLKAFSMAMEAAMPALEAGADEMTGFGATSQRVSKQVGTSARDLGGNVEGAIAQAAGRGGLGGAGLAMAQQYLTSGVTAKGGGAAAQEGSDLRRAILGAIGGAPEGLYGGFGGLGGGAILGEMLGGGKGAVEIMTKDMAAMAAAAAPEQLVQGKGKFQGTRIGITGQGPLTQEDIAAGKLLTATVKDYNAASNRYTETLGQANDGTKLSVAASEQQKTEMIALAEEQQKLGLATGDYVDRVKDLAKSGYVLLDQNGKLVESEKDATKFWQNVTGGTMLPTLEAFAAVAARGLKAAEQVAQIRLEHELGVGIPGRMGMQLAAQPFIPAAAGVLTPKGEGYQGSIGGVNIGGVLRQTQKAQNDLTTQGAAALENLSKWVGEQSGMQAAFTLPTGESYSSGETAFRMFTGQITESGKAIAGWQTKIAGIQMTQQWAQFSNNLRLANRAYADARALAGRGGGGRGSTGEMGGLERQQTLLGFSLTQKQINFQTALAGFQAPGLTSEERAARQEQAQAEARIAQRQLNIQKRMFVVGGDRGVTDTRAGRNLLVSEQKTQTAVAALQRAITAEQVKLSVSQQKAQAVLNKAEGSFGNNLEAAASYVKQFGGSMKEAIKAVYSALGKDVKWDKRGNLVVTTPQTHNPDRGAFESTGYMGRRASGYLGGFAQGATFTVGEAGPETVAILRNPRTHMLGGGGGFGGGGGGGPINVTLNLTVQGDVAGDETVAKIVRAVEDSFNRKAARLGMRGFVSATG